MGGFLTPKKSGIAKAGKAASYEALNAAGRFDKLGPIGQMPGTEEAIDLARANIGQYQPYNAKAEGYIDQSALGVSEEDIERYTNPYIQGVLDYSIKDMEDAMARRQQESRAIASKSGNDFSSVSGPNRYQIENDLLNRSYLREVGGLSFKARTEAYQNALNAASAEKIRQANAGTATTNLGITNQKQGISDVGSLAAVGQMEAIPEENKRLHETNVIANYNAAIQAAQPAIQQYQKTSILGQIVGIAGAVHDIANPGNATGSGSSMFSSGGGGMMAGLGSMFGGGGVAAGGVGGAASASSGMGAFGLGGQALMGGAILGGGSDIRLKKNIMLEGIHPILGIGIYVWTYLTGNNGCGFMAHELVKVRPDAVTQFMGYAMVDYSMLNGVQNG